MPRLVRWDRYVVDHYTSPCQFGIPGAIISTVVKQDRVAHPIPAGGRQPRQRLGLGTLHQGGQLSAAQWHDRHRGLKAAAAAPASAEEGSPRRLTLDFG